MARNRRATRMLASPEWRIQVTAAEIITPPKESVFSGMSQDA